MSLRKTVTSEKKPTSVYLVYTRGLRGPSPEKWFGDQVTGTGQYQHKPIGHPNSKLLSIQALTGYDSNLNLEQLQAKYPYKETTHETTNQTSG